MAIDHLSETVDIPFDRAVLEDTIGVRATDALWKFVRAIQVERLPEIHAVVNRQLDTTTVTWQYFSLPDTESGLYADGSWRMGVNGDYFEVQRKVSGAWTKVTRFGQ